MPASATATGESQESCRARVDDLDEVFFRVTRLMYDITGVNLTEAKRELVRSRLAKRLRALGCDSFTEYVDFVESKAGKRELALMLDTLTTNKTSFFREPVHFSFLRESILPALRDPGRPIRIWSAGCSSGEEPYSLSILLREAFQDSSRRDIRILATDLSRRVLAQAREATYSEAQVEGVSAKLRSRYFKCVKDRESGTSRYQVKPEIRSNVTFAPLNLIDPWPMNGPFQVIFCRNVMIYFDRGIRARLVERFRQLLPKGGHLFVGHSESLNGLSHDLHYVQPAVYRK
jgi:chemotaxis protein methyltransferase CheR